MKVRYFTNTLSTGQKVIACPKKDSNTAVFNIIYNVGSKDESPEKTGLAHLLEHLMFGGTKTIQNYDRELEAVGGMNNAFTSQDVTNYYDILPAKNIETAYWLESDRMSNLDISQKSYDTQQSVVIEEFKQTTLNKPYGDIWNEVVELCFTEHPYQWATIGKSIKQLEDMKKSDAEDFYKEFYTASNSTIVVAGGVTPDQVFDLAEKWFAKNGSSKIYKRKSLPSEPCQTCKRVKTVKRNVPLKAIYMSYLGVPRNDPDFYPLETLSYILGHGQSSPLFQKLVIEDKVFSDIATYNSEHMHKGVFMIGGKLIDGVSFESAEEKVLQVLEWLKIDEKLDYLLEKAKNQLVADRLTSNLDLSNIAHEIAFYDILGDEDLINKTVENYKKITKKDILKVINDYLSEEKLNVLRYDKK